MRVYGEFARYAGPLKVGILAACMVVGQAVFLASQYWLAIWASRSRSEQREAKCVPLVACSIESMCLPHLAT